MVAPSSYLIGLLHNPSFAPGYNWIKSLSPRALWSNPVSSSSNGHRASSLVASPRRELPDAATCHPFLLGTSARVLRPKHVNLPPMLLRPKPPNPLASSVFHTHPLPRRVSPPSLTCQHAKSSWASLNPHVHHLDAVNTITPMSSSHLSMSQVSATAASHSASRSLGLGLTSILRHS
jgi:hypothetical protein